MMRTWLWMSQFQVPEALQRRWVCLKNPSGRVTRLARKSLINGAILMGKYGNIIKTWWLLMDWIGLDWIGLEWSGVDWLIDWVIDWLMMMMMMTMTTTVAIVVVILIFNLLVVEFFESFQLSCWVLFTLSSRFQGCLMFSEVLWSAQVSSSEITASASPVRATETHYWNRTPNMAMTWIWHEWSHSHDDYRSRMNYLEES